MALRVGPPRKELTPENYKSMIDALGKTRIWRTSASEMYNIKCRIETIKNVLPQDSREQDCLSYFLDTAIGLVEHKLVQHFCLKLSIKNIKSPLESSDRK